MVKYDYCFSHTMRGVMKQLIITILVASISVIFFANTAEAQEQNKKEIFFSVEYSLAQFSCVAHSSQREDMETSYSINSVRRSSKKEKWTVDKIYEPWFVESNKIFQECKKLEVLKGAMVDSRTLGNIKIDSFQEFLADEVNREVSRLLLSLFEIKKTLDGNLSTLAKINSVKRVRQRRR